MTVISQEFNNLKYYSELKRYLESHKINCLDFCLTKSELFGGENAYEFVNTLADIHDIDRDEAWREVLGIAHKIYG